MNGSDRGRRRLRIFAFGIAGFFVALALFNWWSGREELRAGSQSLGESEEPLEIAGIPEAYRAVFRVEDRATAEMNVTTEKVWVRRPFESRIETWSGPPPGDERLSVRQSEFGILANRGRNAEPINLAAPPSLASGDLRIDAVLEEGLADDTLVLRERREVFGRECQVYRAGGPVFAGDIQRYDPDASTYADVCVDRHGLVIEEVWMSDGRQIRRRAAVELEIEPTFDASDLTIDVEAEEGPFRGTVQRITDDLPEGVWALPDAPAGFEKLGDYGVVLPEGALPQTSPLLPTVAPSSTSQVYIRGPDLVVVDQDPSLARVIQTEGRETRSVELEGLSEGELIFDARMSEVRGQDEEGSIVRVFGTLPPSELVGLAESLERLGD